MKEIEVLVEVLCSYEEAVAKLSSLGKCTRKYTKDTYFYDPLRKDLQPGDDYRLNASFRIRDKDGEYFMAYKKDNFNKGTWQYSDEHEIKVDNYKVCCEIVNHLGLKELVTINNIKCIYSNSEYEIVLEKVENLGVFLEIEYLDGETERSVNEVKNQIYAFLAKMELPCSSELNAGKPELMLKKIGTTYKSGVVDGT